MRFLRLTCLTLIAVGCALGCARAGGADSSAGRPPVVSRGVLDLSGFDLAAAGPVELSGEWEIYPFRLLHPADFNDPANPPPKPDFVKFPGKWNGQTFAGRSFEADGFATYRLRVRTGETPDLLSLKIPHVYSAHRCYVNGSLVHSNGTVGTTRESSRPGWAPSLAVFARRGDTVEIVLQISNFHHRFGGPRFALFLGGEKQIRSKVDKQNYFNLILCGALLIIGFYHLGLYALRRKDRSALYFALFALLVALRPLLVGELVLLKMFPWIPWEWHVKVTYLMLYLGLAAFCLFLKHLLPKDMPAWAPRIFVPLGLVFSLFLAVTPVRLGTRSLPVFSVIVLLALVVFITVVIRVAWRGRREALLFLFGLLVLSAATVFDLLLANRLVEGIFLIPIGLFIFFFSQAVMLALRFSRGFDLAETLSVELEDRVRERTRELATARDEALRASQTKSDFLANMSHEIRTPMNAIVGTADLLNETRLDADQSKYVRTFRSAADVLLRLLNDILDISRAESRDMEFEQVPFAPGELLEQIVEIMAVSAGQKNLELRFSKPANLPAALMGDPGRLRQVLINLLNNAIKFTDTGFVGLDVEILDGGEGRSRLRFAVSDTGIGIPPAARETIFEKFTQVDGSVRRKFGGSGLGLAISRMIVEGQGGSIWLESAVGRGTTFFFELSFAPANEGPGSSVHNESEIATRPDVPVAAAKPAAETIETVGSILLAEDSPDNRFLIEAYLKSFPCRLDMVSNGEEALAAWERKKYALILMDVQMPGLDGLEATRKIRALEKEQGLAPTPIIALTAFSTREDQLKSERAGCNAHLVKPLRKAELLEAIEKWAGNRD